MNHRSSDWEGSQELIFFDPPDPHNSYLNHIPPQTQPAPTHIPGEDLYLAVDVIVLSKHQKAPDEASQERVHRVGLSLQVGLQGTEALVGEHEAGQVRRVGVRGLQDGPKLLPEAAQNYGITMSAGSAIGRAFSHWACKTKPHKELRASNIHVLRAAGMLDSGLNFMPLPRRVFP